MLLALTAVSTLDTAWSFPRAWKDHVLNVRGRKSVPAMYRLATRPNIGLWVVERAAALCVAGACTPDWHWELWARTVLPAAARSARLSKPVYFVLHGWDEPLSPYPRGCLDPQRETWFKHVLDNPHGVLTPEDAQQSVIFSPAVIQGCHTDILFPYGEEVQNDEERRGADAIPHTPWQAKKARLAWRGSPTGGGGAENHRLRTVQLIHAMLPDGDVFFNVGAVRRRWFQPDPPGHVIVDASLVRKSIPFADFARYKYLLDVGGHSYSRRLARLGQLNSTLLLFHAFSDLATLALRPRIDYVPISNVSDVASALTMLQKRDTLAFFMAQNARRRLRKALTPSSLEQYTRFVLEHLDRTCTFETEPKALYQQR